MSTYRTRNLIAAAYISATQSLPFLRCESIGNGLFVFCFEDPENRGAALELQAMGGAVVSAVAFHSAIRTLRGAMTSQQQQFRDDDNYGNRQTSRRY
jgi:hypothetical protein